MKITLRELRRLIEGPRMAAGVTYNRVPAKKIRQSFPDAWDALLAGDAFMDGDSGAWTPQTFYPDCVPLHSSWEEVFECEFNFFVEDTPDGPKLTLSDGETIEMTWDPATSHWTWGID